MSTNIGRSNDDSAFRYKMPKLQTKVEGRGNGIKTVIVNMVDVAKALHVEPSYPTKFFGFELGAQSKFEKDTDRAIVNGAHSAGDLQKLLDKYISIFVLCPRCKLPEIKMEVSNSKIKVDCAACGYNEPLKSSHKLAAFMVKNAQNYKTGSKDEDDGDEETGKKKTKKKKDEKIEKKKGKKKKDSDDESKDSESPKDEETPDAAGVSKSKKTGKSKKEDDEDKVEWFTDVSKEAQKQRQHQEFAEMGKRAAGLAKTDSVSSKSEDATDATPLPPPPPLPKQLSSSSSSSTQKESPGSVFKTFIQLAGSNGRTTAEILAELRRLQMSRGLDETQRVKTLFLGIFDVKEISGVVTIVSQVQKQAPLLKKFATDKASTKIFVGCLEDLVGNVQPRLIPYIPHILQTLYEGEVLSEEVILTWSDSPPEASWLVNKELALSIRERAKPFIDWLKTAAEEEDE